MSAGKECRAVNEESRLVWERDFAADAVLVAVRMADQSTLPPAVREAVAKYHATLDAIEDRSPQPARVGGSEA